MKKLRFALYLLAAALFLVPGETSAQGRFGKDSAECVNNLNFYQDYLRQGNMEEAYSYWKDAMKFCPPRVSQNLYINGRKILLHRLSKTTDAAARAGIMDSILNLAETRASLFAKNAKKAKEGRLSDIMVFYGQAFFFIYFFLFFFLFFFFFFLFIIFFFLFFIFLERTI